ncbi:hypothetical protein LOY35_19595 [Pseudomonas sp. B21-028]|jgi:hypothetical protein|uniref:hypothetical protein n=1 Tax=Pseudomonas sp. B21-028 TaxID=2895480 RepID=UPI002160131C|nr:hypothetical protein [Pseudomonas sp. B21-028]UVL82401.1 hypothetical protein LOY35_19595 [Pseudomonas sp. B21-028]
MPVSISMKRGMAMGAPYSEESAAAYPINEGLQCGQSAYRSDFGDEPIKSIRTKVAKVQRGEKAKFLPRVPARK